MKTNNQTLATGLRSRTAIKAGSITHNHNQTLTGLRSRTAIKAGPQGGHGAGLRLKTAIQAGPTAVEY